MKTTKISLFLFLIVTMLFCCKEDSTEPLLQQMEQIKEEGDSNPEKALADLQALKPNVELRESDYVRNKYLLLQARLRDKAFIMPTSSDTVETLVDYFTNNGSIEEQMEAYYYEASAYRDLKDFPRALTSFHKVIDIANNNGIGDCRFLQNAYSQLTSIYLYQQLYDEALKMAKAGCEMAERTHTVDPIYLMDVATSAWFAQDTATHIEYCLKTLECLKEDTAEVFPSVFCELLSRFSDLKMSSETEECYTILHSSDAYREAHNFLSAMASYHDFRGDMDSAIIYYKRLLQESTMARQRKDAAQRIMDYYIDRSQYEIATKYAKQYEEYVDAVFKEYQYESTSRASGEHLYAISLKKEVQARKEADNYKIRTHYKIRIYGLIATFLAAALIAGFIYHRKREHYLKELLNKDKQIKDIVRISLHEKANIDSNAMVKKFHDASFGKCAIEESDWQDLYNTVEKLHPGFRKAAMTMPRNSEQNIKTAYLLKLGMSNTQIANLTSCSRQTVWDRVRKVKNCMGSFLDAKIS